ncbi:terminase large subunit [Rhodococcus phage Mbo2]|uniref:Terminase large subunit n=1 Tax=Rhodococcus phage Mbo2 TaxID=2936911 RepID=A0A9E7ILL2_9CAUD|nr:terminase large subunit [Rhodococcus phage Mbo2]
MTIKTPNLPPPGSPNSWGPNHNQNTLGAWLIANPDFEDRPATIEQFLGPGYLDIDPDQNPHLPKGVGIRPGVKQALVDIFGTELDPRSISDKREALFTGGIGIGKTTMASVALAYMVHWVCCLHDPQAYFGMLPGSRIAFMLMSTKDSQAKEVLFGDIKARINVADWFKNMETPWKGNTPYDPEYRNQLRFPKDIWVIPGNSAETTFEGYNILGGILDEGDSHKVTENKDYAQEGWRTIKARVTSRFTDPETNTHRGLLIAIGQMKAAEGFMARMKKTMLDANEKREQQGLKPECKVVEMAIWESIGWERFRDKKTGKIDIFYFDITRRIVVPEGPALHLKGKLDAKTDTIIPIPMNYWSDFDLNPVQALKDHAGIPPSVEDPFIATPDRVDEAQEKWHRRFDFTPVGSKPHQPEFSDELHGDALKRVLHVDIAYASGGDALGMAMAHIPELVEIDGELKPIIVFDWLLRIKPSGGQTLMLKDFRRIIREMRDDRKYKINLVTLDGFQSQDSIQLLREARFNTDLLSVDRNKAPYEELREAIYERRVEFPKYMTYLKKGETEKVNIARKELLELTDTGRKIDHPLKGSKDVADAMAGCVYALMSGTQFRRGAKRPGSGQYDPDAVPDLSSFVAKRVPVGAGAALSPAALGQGNQPQGKMSTQGYGPHNFPNLPVDPFKELRRPGMH